MPIVRHDAIQLNAGVNEQDFTAFMTGILMPFFKKTYKGLTRVTIANLKDQALLKDLKNEGKYIWVNSWLGSEDSISDLSFKGVLMTDIREEETKIMLQKLKAFGKRKISGIFNSIE